MAITICTISGTLLDPTTSAISGATVKANLNRPFIHPTNSALVANYEVSTTTASDGTWSLALGETATPVVTVTISFVYPQGASSGNLRYEYTIVVPNQSSATFASLIGNQV